MVTAVSSARSSSLKSKISLKSVKSAARQVPRTKACPWVAQWFTIPQAVVKVLQFVLSVPAVVLILVWNSEGITIGDLDNGSVNYRNTLYIYTGIGILSALYSIGMTSVGLSGIKLPPIMQTILAGAVLLTWLLGAPVMSASIEQLENSHFVRSRGINTVYLLIATALGFACLAICLIDILLGFQSMRSIDEESKQFVQEMNQSKSVISAVQSGLSFADARRASTSIIKSGSKISKPVDETSPLKSNEVAQGSEADEA